MRRAGSRVLVNSVVIAACRVFGAGSALLLIPLIIGDIGISGYGTWEAVLAATTLLSMALGAVGNTLLWRMSTAFGSGRTDQIRADLRLGAAGVLIAATVAIPVVWVTRGAIIGALNVPPELRNSLRWILPFMTAVVVIGSLCESIEAVISAHQRAAMATMIFTGSLLVNYLAAVVGLKLGQGMTALAVGAAAGLLTRLGAGYAVASRLTGAPLSLVPRLPSSEERRDLSRYSSALLIGYASAALRDSTDKLVLATLASPQWTGYYGIAARLAGLALEASRFMYTPLLTAAGALSSAADWPGVQRLYSQTMRVIPVLTGMAVVALAAFTGQLQVAWIGHASSTVTMILLILLTGNAFAVMLTGPGTAICRGVGQIWVETRYTIVGVILNVLLTVALVIAVGPLGSVMASAASWALSAALFTWLLHRTLDLPVAATRQGAIALVVAIALGLTLNRLLTFALPTNRLQAAFHFVMGGTAAAMLYVSVLVIAGVVSPRAIGRGIRGVAARLSGPAPRITP